VNMPLAAFEEVLNSSRYNIYTKNSDIIMLMRLGLPSGVETYDFFNENPLRDKMVRRAIAHAIDTRSFVKDDLLGNAQLIVIPTVQRLEGYPTHLTYYEYDVEYSKYLMSLTGYADGFDMKIHVLDGQLSVALVEKIKASLQKININVEYEIYSSVEYRGVFREHRYNAHLQGYQNIHYSNIIEAIESIRINPLSDVALYSIDPRFSSILDELKDMNIRDNRKILLYKELSDMIYDEALIIPFFESRDIYVVDKRFTYNASNVFRYIDFRTKK